MKQKAKGVTNDDLLKAVMSLTATLSEPVRRMESFSKTLEKTINMTGLLFLRIQDKEGFTDDQLMETQLEVWKRLRELNDLHAQTALQEIRNNLPLGHKVCTQCMTVAEVGSEDACRCGANAWVEGCPAEEPEGDGVEVPPEVPEDASVEEVSP